MTKVLIIDDDQAICTILKDVLETEGYEVTYSLTGEEGMRSYAQELPSVVLLDLRLPGVDGLVVLKDILGFDPDAVVLIMTGFGTVDSAVSAIRLGAADYLQKPLSNDEIILKIENALRNRVLAKELSYLKEFVGGRSPVNIIGESKTIRTVVEALRKMAAYDQPILITGEHGTGKNLAARSAHEAGKRRGRPLVVFDCSTFPPAGIERELFGTNDGDQGRSKVDEAERGTLFLENIDFLPLPAQQRVLALLHRRTFQMEHDEAGWDGQVIASTALRLGEPGSEARFHPNLRQAFREHVITLPPLRDREEDIPLLADHFLDQANKELRASVSGFEPDAMRKLVSYSWPGNIRELRGTVRNAVRTTRAPLIRKEDLSIGESR
ncbi:MAG: sigma-54-dependent transcriptional regulator [Bacteroidota bacterium]